MKLLALLFVGYVAGFIVGGAQASDSHRKSCSARVSGPTLVEVWPLVRKASEGGIAAADYEPATREGYLELVRLFGELIVTLEGAHQVERK